MLDAVDLLFDRRGDGVGHHLRTGAGYVVVTCTVGGVISGYCSIGNSNTVTRPKRTVSTAITLAKTGCSMKNRENMT